MVKWKFVGGLPPSTEPRPLSNPSPLEPLAMKKALSVAAVLLLSACASTPQDEVADADEASEVSAPPNPGGLFAEQRQSARRSGLAVPPDLLDSANQNVRDKALDKPDESLRVLPEVIGVDIKTKDGKSWLEIDADATEVWRKLTDFWAFYEIELVQYQPEAGLMETDWFAKKTDDVKQGYGTESYSQLAGELLQALFNRSTTLDKYTLRLERNGTDGTRVFASHRAREKIAQQPKNKQDPVVFEWVERDGDGEKVAQLLQSIVLLFDSGAAEEPA